MSNNPFVSVTITRETRVPTQAGFGTPLIWTKDPSFSGVRTYSSISAVQEDFLSSTETYKLASFLFSQAIAPEEIKIAKRPDVGDIDDELAAVIALDNDWYALLTDLKVEYSTDDSTDIKALAAYVEALGSTNPKLLFLFVREPDVLDPSSTTDIAYELEALGYDRTIVCFTKEGVAQTVTITFAGDLITGNKINGKVGATAISEVTFSDDHATTMGLLETAIEAVPGVDAVTVGGRVLTVVMDIGSDFAFTGWLVTGGATATTATIAETVEPDFSRETNRNHAAWVGGQLPKAPGSITWKFKELKGCVADVFSDTEVGAAEDKAVNIYREIGGLGVTSEGVCVSGEYIDVIHGLDFVEARMVEGVFGALASADKIPYTDAGVTVLEGKVKEVLNLAITQGIFRADPAPTVTVGKVADQSTADRAARYFPAIEWSAELAGAVHKVAVRGKVSV